MRSRITTITYISIVILCAVVAFHSGLKTNYLNDISLKSFTFEYKGNLYSGELCSIEALLAKNCGPILETEHFSTFWQLHEDNYSRTKTTLGRKGRVLSPYVREGKTLHFDRWNKDPLANTIMIQYPSEVLEEIVLFGQDLSHASRPPSENPAGYNTADEVLFATKHGSIDSVFVISRKKGNTHLTNNSRIILIQQIEGLIRGGEK